MLEDLNNIRQDLIEYFEVRLDQIRVHTAENISRILSNAASIAIIGYVLFFILFFLSLAAGYLFSGLLNSNALGFLCVAFFYALLLVFFLIFRKQIIERPIIRSVVKLFFPKFSDNEK